MTTYSAQRDHPVPPEPHRERALGFWLYLITDAVLFAVLFANYAVLLPGTAGGPAPGEIFTLWRVAAETGLLLCSSLTFGFLAISALSGAHGRANLWLLVTFLLGAGFVALEIGEFAEMAANGATPQRSGFLSGFVALVGTHGLHVSFGLLMLAVMFVQIQVKGLTHPVLSRLYRLGLFWHFLDLIWIGIFSFVYLPGLVK
ncbi:MAG: cytochrome c oxidase subunit 3 [Alphaproteobacteria bacterium]|nr:cytochrome c oxidase subunit 3 [Alphaproteobacteria bacterium]MCB9931438.1 cytochrome c oxidase subunit 3 [Alphaproteobacteria bacterium]